MKKGIVGKLTTFSGPIPYKESNYNIKQEILRKELAEHRAKV